MDDRVALIDLDGTLVDYETKLAADLKAMASPGEPPVKLAWDDAEPWLKARMDAIKSVPGWWANLLGIHSGFWVMEQLRLQGFRIHVLTKGPRHSPSAWSEKLMWCQKHIGPDVNVTITQDKGLVYGRVLVDDYPEYMARWLEYRPRGLGLMRSMPYNESFEHPNVLKYSDFHMESPDWREQFRARVAGAFTREGGV